MLREVALRAALVALGLLALLCQPTSSALGNQDVLLDLAARCNAQDGGSWPPALNWTADAPLCSSWIGVRCDSTETYVVSVSVSGTDAAHAIQCNASDLAGIAFQDLSHLSAIDFSDQGFSGELPATLFLAPALQYIDLARNSLSFIPQRTAANHSLIGLLSVDLAGNRIAGPLNSFALGQRLNHLDLSHNAITGSIPDDLVSSKMVSLRLTNNSVAGTIPESLWQPSLRTLDLRSNALTGTISSSIGNIAASAAYADVLLGRNSLSGSIPVTVTQLTNLEILDVEFNALSGHVPELDDVEDMELLQLAGNDFDCPLPSPVSAYQNASASCSCRAGLYGDAESCRYCPLNTFNGNDGSSSSGWITACTPCPTGLETRAVGAVECVATTTTTTTEQTTTTHPADDAVEHQDWGIFAGGVWLFLILVATAASFGQEFGDTKPSRPRENFGRSAEVLPMKSVDLTFGNLSSVRDGGAHRAESAPEAENAIAEQKQSEGQRGNDSDDSGDSVRAQQASNDQAAEESVSASIDQATEDSISARHDGGSNHGNDNRDEKHKHHHKHHKHHKHQKQRSHPPPPPKR